MKEERIRVKVYYNIRKKILSVLYKGKVVMHTEEIYLRNVKFKVNEAGRQRVLATKQKNVHAFIEGDIVFDGAFEAGVLLFPSACEHECNILVTYNPYKYSTFVIKDNESPVTECKQVYIIKNEIWGDL